VNKNYKILKLVSTGVAIAFSYQTVAAAGELIDNTQQPEANSANSQVVPWVLQKQPKNLQLNTLFNQLISQSPPAEESSPTESNNEATSQEANSDNQFLNPSANPLLFPTKPEEVRTDIAKPITLKQAIELAVSNNKDLQESRLNLERSLKELQEAEAALYPTLDGQLDLTRTESATGERSLELARQRGSSLIDEETTTDTVNGTLSLNYNVYTGGQRGANIRRAKRQVRSNELDLERITEETRFNASRDYYELQNADAQVEIEQAAVEDANQTLRDAQLLEQAGLGTRFDVLRAEVELANAQQRLTTAQANQKTARRQLVQTLSLGQQVELQTADEIKEAGIWEISLEETILLAYKNRAELEQFLVQREIDEFQRQIALANIRPQVSVFANYNLFEQFDDDVDTTDGYTLGARVQWTFFDGGAARARAKQEETDISIDETQFANQRNQIRLQVEQAYFNLTANQKNISTAEKAVELAEESLRLARLRFQAGVGTQTDVIEAQSDLTTARGNLLTAIIDYNQSLNQLQRAVSNLPSGKLFDLP
jgi:outer membrane protein TolC